MPIIGHKKSPAKAGLNLTLRVGFIELCAWSRTRSSFVSVS